MKRVTATILAVMTVVGISPWAATEGTPVPKQSTGLDNIKGALPGPRKAPLLALAAPPTTSKPITNPLRALSSNPNYFTDGTGKAIYLTGSHTWNSLQDWGTDNSIQPLNFTAFVNTLVAHHHNFTLLWTTELPTFHALPTTASSPPDFSVTPFPWQRTGPGNASDGNVFISRTTPSVETIGATESIPFPTRVLLAKNFSPAFENASLPPT